MVCRLESGRIWYAYIAGPLLYGYFIGSIHETVLLSVILVSVLDITQTIFVGDAFGWTLVSAVLGALIGIYTHANETKSQTQTGDISMNNGDTTVRPKCTVNHRVKMGAAVLLLFVDTLGYITAKTISRMTTVIGFPYGILLSIGVCLTHGLIAHGIISSAAEPDSMCGIKMFSITSACVTGHISAIVFGATIFGVFIYPPMGSLRCRGSFIDIVYIGLVSATLMISTNIYRRIALSVSMYQKQ